MQMGGGEINQQGRERWHDYMVNHYHFGTATGVEQGFEADGTIPDPNKGFGLNIQYANTTFGQGMTATPLQMAAAFAAVLNGGTYYQPHLIDATIDGAGKETKQAPKVINSKVVKPEVGKAIQEMLTYTYEKNRLVYGTGAARDGYIIGGKTGTAQVPNPSGGYYDDRFTGTYLGFVGGAKAKYIVVVRVNEPHIAGYAGAKAAAPIFGSLATTLINNFDITPSAQ
jgi:cell division protein FtsI/penicillin-binding protein 2